MARKRSEGFEGWDEYAPFYDWENARTLGRRDVPFWRTVALGAGGTVLELGCGTGRIALPLGRAGVLARRHRSVGARCWRALVGGSAARVERPRLAWSGATFARCRFPSGGLLDGDRAYGVLQSLLRERDLAATLQAVHRVLRPGGTFGVELVADLPSWDEYQKRVSLKGWRNRRGGAHVTLVETVRQDRARHLTIFDQEFTERRGRTRRIQRFALTFRTLSVPQMARRLEKAGFEITALLGDYRGGRVGSTG